MTRNRSVYTSAWVAKRRNTWLAEHGPCVQCGSWEQLEIDHIDPATKDPRLKNSASNYWSWNKSDQEAELAKCQVLCRACHRIKTNRELARSECPKGHAVTGENAYPVPHTNRVTCRICKNSTARKSQTAIRRKKQAATKAKKNLETSPFLVVFS